MIWLERKAQVFKQKEKKMHVVEKILLNMQSKPVTLPGLGIE